jgi:two-component system LytT family sensor kinase
VQRRDPDEPLLSHRTRMLLLALGTGAATGLHLGLLHWFAWKSWLAPITFLTGGLIYSSTTYALWRWVLPHVPIRRFVPWVIVQTLICVAAFTLVSVATVQGLASLLPDGTAASLSTATLAEKRRWLGIYTILPIVPTTVATMIGYHLVYRRIDLLVSETEHLRALAATAQLNALRAQLNPHFLFNSLNSIAQLVHTAPDEAEEHIERLAEILRYALRSGERELVRLADEIRITEAYLGIERARFDDRLVVDATFEPAALDRLVPNLVLQPLVENAVKHGLSAKLGPGRVSISATVVGDGLRLTVEDDGVGMDGDALAAAFDRGVGLRNLRERLQHLYGIDGPTIRSEPGHGTIVEVLLPLAARGVA